MRDYLCENWVSLLVGHFVDITLSVRVDCAIKHGTDLMAVFQVNMHDSLLACCCCSFRQGSSLL